MRTAGVTSERKFVMPTKPLPPNPNLEHLKHQAKDLLHDHQLRTLEAGQRIREFHPRFRRATDAAIGTAKLSLSDAQLTIAREYGFSSWPRLRACIESPNREDLSLPKHERIEDPVFRRAVDLLDAGDAEALRVQLLEHPGLVRKHVTFEGGNYFSHPTLLEFVAENPTRRGKLPKTIVQVATAILDAGAKADQSSLDSTLALVSSSSIARECGVQLPLIDVLCDYGADPNAGMRDALLYGEFEAVNALIRRGATVDLNVAAATGRVEEARTLLSASDEETRQRALALAAQYGHVEIVRMLLDAGEDPNRYSPVGGHSHATPLHQAALAGHGDVVRLLVERGANLNLKDIHHQATPLDWANYAGQSEVAELVRSLSP
jgi:hypothetical protein